MPFDLNNPASFNEGSATAPAASSAGQANTDYEKSYKELESRFGTQGQELGEYRTFFDNIGPLLDKLDGMPELVKAIEDGKIDASLAAAVAEGRVSINDAKAVTQAHEEVKSTLGVKKFEKTSAEEIEKLVEAKFGEITKKLEEKDELKSFESYTLDFIASTPDFPEYADAIDKWLADHQDITDIEVAYYAIKGHISEAIAKKKLALEQDDIAKTVALNASGGGSRANYSVGGQSLADQLIAGGNNPNSFLPGF